MNKLLSFEDKMFGDTEMVFDANMSGGFFYSPEYEHFGENFQINIGVGYENWKEAHKTPQLGVLKKEPAGILPVNITSFVQFMDDIRKSEKEVHKEHKFNLLWNPENPEEFYNEIYRLYQPIFKESKALLKHKFTLIHDGVNGCRESCGINLEELRCSWTKHDWAPFPEIKDVDLEDGVYETYTFYNPKSFIGDLVKRTPSDCHLRSTKMYHLSKQVEDGLFLYTKEMVDIFCKEISESWGHRITIKYEEL